MKRLLLATSLLLALSGCAFGKYMLEDPDGPEGPEPPRWESASGEVISGGLTGFEQGGILAGIAGAVFTAGKTVWRHYSKYKAARAAVEVKP